MLLKCIIQYAGDGVFSYLALDARGNILAILELSVRGTRRILIY